MLSDWLKAFSEEQQMPAADIGGLGFYETEEEKNRLEEILSTVKTDPDLPAIPLLPLISASKNKKLASACEISRMPVLLFLYDGLEVARLNRVASAQQVITALESIRQLAPL